MLLLNALVPSQTRPGEEKDHVLAPYILDEPALLYVMTWGLGWLDKELQQVELGEDFDNPSSDVLIGQSKRTSLHTRS